ncbi:MAG: ABC transporter ATP-binding protein [Maricaulaceae bacterium]
MPACVSLKDLTFAYQAGQTVLTIPVFELGQGERLFLQGASGSGKSTLLSLISGVFAPSSGELTVLGHPLHALSAGRRDALRANAIGVIFQQFNLVPYLTLIENVLLPCRFSPPRAARVGATDAARREAALSLLTRLGLGAEAADNRAVSALSVGQQQRVAAARALIGAPSLIIADEPTSALDTQTRDGFIDTLLQEAGAASVLFVSHDIALAARFDRTETMARLNTIGARTGEAA